LSNSYKDRLLAKESKIDTECQTWQLREMRKDLLILC
jgi:hypothetical protein